MGRICLFVINLMLFCAPSLMAQPTDEELTQEFDELLLWVQNAIGNDRFAQLREIALTRLQEGNVTGFDPLVGDTSCELRALTAMLLRNTAQLTPRQQNFATLTYILGAALVMPRNTDGFNVHPRGGDNDIEQMFEACDFRCGGSTKKALITKLQRAVAIGSVLFARMQAALVAGERGAALCDLFQNQCRFDNFRRPVVPCLGVCHLLLERARICGFPIILRLRLAANTTGPSLGTITVAYTVGPNGRLRAIAPSALVGNPPVVVVEGVTRFFENPQMLPPTAGQVEAFVGGLNFEQALTIDSIFHPQFAGNIKYLPLDAATGNPIAATWTAWWQVFTPEVLGLVDGRITQNDPRPIRVDHIYPETLANAREYNAFGLVPPPAQPIHLVNALYFPAQAMPNTARLIAAALALVVAINDMTNSMVRK